MIALLESHRCRLFRRPICCPTLLAGLVVASSPCRWPWRLPSPRAPKPEQAVHRHHRRIRDCRAGRQPGADQRPDWRIHCHIVGHYRQIRRRRPANRRHADGRCAVAGHGIGALGGSSSSSSSQSSSVSPPAFTPSLSGWCGMTFSGLQVKLHRHPPFSRQAVVAGRCTAWGPLGHHRTGLAGLLITFAKAARWLPGRLARARPFAGDDRRHPDPVRRPFEGVQTIGTAFGASRKDCHLQWPPADLYRVVEPLGPALTIALLGAIESLLSAVVADGMAVPAMIQTGADRRASATSSRRSSAALTATGALACTATNIRNGGTSPLAGFVHGPVLIAIMLVAAPGQATSAVRLVGHPVCRCPAT